MTDLAQRLRDLRDRKNWTVADMAERTGIPKRSLDKYMLRSGASLPGFDAICSLSTGLGVSLDWLVFGAERAGEGAELFAERAAHEVISLFAETLIKYQIEGNSAVVTPGSIIGLEPEVWAADLASRAGEMARELAQSGTTKEDLLTWKYQRKARLEELFRDRVRAVTSPATGN